DRVDAADDLHRPGAVEPGEREVDLPDAGRLPPGTPAVPVPLQAGFNARPGSGCHVRVTVEDLGDGRRRHSDLISDRGDRGGTRSGNHPFTCSRIAPHLTGSFGLTVAVLRLNSAGLSHVPRG